MSLQRMELETSGQKVLGGKIALIIRDWSFEVAKT